MAALYVFDKLGRREVDEATAGDMAAVVGLESVAIGDTIADRGIAARRCRGSRSTSRRCK